MPFSTLILNLIREFLEFFELEFTLSVFEPETKYGMEYSEITRDKMIKELKMADSSKKNPLLLEVIHRVVNNNMLGVASPLKNAENLPYNNISDFNENTHIKLSPVSLNTTFVKKPENDSLSASPTEKESRCDTNESIKEEVTSNNYR